MGSSPSFLYRNRWGVYCFQRRVPKHFRQADPSLPKFIRRSLSTHDKTAATRMARRISTAFDDLAKQYFASPAQFAKAIKLLQHYRTAEQTYPRFPDFQRNFLDQLDDVTDRETELLSKAFDYLLARSLEVGNAVPEIPQIDRDWLQSQIERLVSRSDSSNHQDDTHTKLKPLEDAMNEFISEKRHNWKQNSETEKSFRNEVFPLFLELHGNVNTYDLRKDQIVAFKNVVLRFPKNRRKMPEYRNLTIEKLQAIEVPENEQLSDRTKSYYLAKLASFLVWLDTNGYCQSNLAAPLRRVIKPKTRAQEERAAFTDADLTKLFNNDFYRLSSHRYPFQYWVPLIGLFTGARLNEICQLFVSDVYQDPESRLWVFDINEKNSAVTRKSLKRHHHARCFPVHPTLIRLGLLDFVGQRKKEKSERLFPELPYRANRYGDKAQRWFNVTYRRQCHITAPKTSFHSFRHTHINYLGKQLNLRSNEFAHYVGHSPSGNETDQRYTKRLTLREFERRLRRLNFDHCIDFSEIRPWRTKKQAHYKKTR